MEFLGARDSENTGNLPRTDSTDADFITRLKEYLDKCNVLTDNTRYSFVRDKNLWLCSRVIKIDWRVEVEVYDAHDTGRTKKIALQHVCRRILDKLPQASAVVQMENENAVGQITFGDFEGDPLAEIQERDTSVDNASEDQKVVATEENVGGVTNQISTKASNTIITTDKTRGGNRPFAPNHSRLIKICSSEPTHVFSSVQQRWTPLLEIVLQAGGSNNQIFYPIDLLLQNRPCSIATIPFETFVYGNLNCSLMFKVNANKFQSGKYVAAVIKDPTSLEIETNNGLLDRSVVNAEHVIIDINSCQDTILRFPFIYPRTFNRPVEAVGGNPGYEFGHIYACRLYTLVPLTVGAGSVQDVTLTVFLRFDQCDFAGMVPRLTSFTGRALPRVQIGYDQMIKTLDSTFKSVGFAPLMDKPSVVESTVIVPRAVYMNSCGRGYSHADKLYVDGGRLTSYYPDHNDEDAPTSYNELARIWGVHGYFDITPDRAPGYVLYQCNLDPARVPTEINGTVGRNDRNFLPIQVAASSFQFWSGTQEFRFDFASTNFHTASISVTFEFGRPQPDDECGGFSSYTKTFHLSEQKTFHVTCPYIYETPYRRTQTNNFFGQEMYGIYAPDMRVPRSRTAIHQASFAKMVVRVINRLRPTQNVNQTVRCLIFRRGGESFNLKGPISPNGYMWIKTDPPDNFPMDYTTPTVLDELPHVQMDTGDKEDLDPTKDFNSGVSANTSMIGGDETHFYTLMRTPVQFLAGQRVGHSGTSNTGTTPSTQYAYFIPIQPLSPGFLGPNSTSNDPQLLFGYRHSHMYQICSMFRHWRGSLRYTFVFQSVDGTAPGPSNVYIFHLPHSGVRILGNKYLNSPDGVNVETDIVNTRFGTAGYRMTIVSLSVNPVVTIEVPFNFEANWCRTCDLDPNKNELYGEKGMFNTGHLVVQTQTPTIVSFDCFIEIGADFKLHGFAPISRLIYPASRDGFMLDDARGAQPPDRKKTAQVDHTCCALPHVQMFSGFRNLVSDTVSSVKNLSSSVAVPMAMSIVSPSLATGIVMGKANKAIDENAPKIQNLIGKIDESNDELKHILEQVKLIIDPLARVFSDVVDYSAVITDCIFEFAHCFVSPSISTLSISFVNILRKLGFVTVDSVTSLMANVSNIFQFLLPRPTIQFPSVDENKDWYNAVCSFCGLLVGAISAALSIDWRGDWKSNMRGLFKSSGMVWSVAVNSARFLKDTLKYIKRIFLSLIGQQTPEVLSLEFFQEKSEFVKSFILDAQDMLLEINAPQYRTNPHARVKGWVTMMNACIIQRELANIGQDARNIAPTLGRLCSQVVDRANTLSCDMTASPVRYEPFVLCLEGNSGIGKSFITTDLIVSMLREIGYRTTSLDVAFVKNPGPEFWNGIDNQPVIVYDDWMASSDPTVETAQLMELMSLKSTAVFNPNIAHLEQKNKKINPLIIILLCNQAYPQVSQSMRTPHAIYRRRDAVWNVALKQGYNSLDDVPEEELQTFDYLEFYQYNSVINKRAGKQPKCSYSDFKNKTNEQHTNFNTVEKRNVKRRLDLLQQLLPDNATRYNYEHDPFSLFYSTQMQVSSTITQNAMLPSEVLAQYIVTFLERLETATQPTVQFEWDQASTNIVNIVNHLYHFTSTNSPLQVIFSQVRRFSKFIFTPAEPEPPIVAPNNNMADPNCAACYEPLTENNWVCSSDTLVHGVCDDCFVRLQRAAQGGQFDGCPVCRAPTWFRNYTPGERNKIFKFLQDVCKFATSSERVNYIMSKLASPGDIPCLIIETIIFSTLINRFILTDSPPIDTPLTLSQVLAEYSYRMTRSAIAMQVTTSFQYISHYFCRMFNLEMHYTEHQTNVQMEANLDDESEEEDFTEALAADAWHVPMMVRHPETLTQEWMERINLTALDFNTLIHDHDSDINHFLHQADYRKVNVRNVLPVQEVHHTDRCLHYKFFSHPRHVYYQNGQWYLNGLPDVPTGTMVHDYACDGEANCPFTHSFGRLTWYAAFTATPQYWTIQTMVNNAADSETLFQSGRVPLWAITPDAYTNNVREAFLQLQALQADIPNQTNTALRKVSKFLARAFKLVLGGIAAFGVVFALYKTSKAMYNLFFPASPGTQMTYDPSTRPRLLTRQNPRVVTSLGLNPGASVQGGDQDGFTEVIMQKLMKNSGFIEARNTSNNRTKMMRFQGIRGKYALIPRHYVEFMAANPTQPLSLQSVSNPSICRPYIYDKADFIVSETMDAALFKLPIHYPPFADLVKFIPSEQHWKGMAISDKISILETKSGAPSIIHYVNAHGIESDLTLVNYDNSLFKIHTALAYNLSRPGLCGSMAVLDKGNKPLVGMHIAGMGLDYQGKGYSFLLTAEDLDWIPKVNEAVPKIKDTEPARVMPCGEVQMEYIGRVDRRDQNYISTDTKMVPSLIAKHLQDWKTKEPAILSSRDPRYTHPISPLVAGINKHGKMVNHIQTRYLLQVSSMLNELLTLNIPHRSQVGSLSPQQAVVGFTNLEYYTPMELTTSSGYPWSLNGATTKERYIKYIRDEQEQPIDCEISEEVLMSLIQREDQRIAGTVPATLFCDSLKDELKASDSLGDLGKTRVFCMSPIDATIEFRQYYLDFVASYMKNRHSLCHAVGITPDGPEWTQVLLNLQKKNNRFVCFDYSNFGPGFSAQFGEVAMDAINNWYSAFGGHNIRDHRIREIMKFELLNSKHIAVDCVYQQFCGSPSGAAITTVINSLVNTAYIMFAYILHMEQEHGKKVTLSDFQNDVAAYVYGDDVILSSKRQDFNGAAIQNIFKFYGIKVTSSLQKNQDVEKFVTLNQARFLKRGFIIHPNRQNFYLAPIEQSSILNCALWVWKTPDMKFATQENMRAALNLAYSCGENYFNHIKNKINAAARQEGLSPILLTWTELDQQFFG